MVRITPASALAFMVGETISPKLSLSNQTHMATESEVPGASSTQAALPPRVPALTTVAPGNFWSEAADRAGGRGVGQVAADEHDDLLGVPGGGVPGFVDRGDDVAGLAGAHLDDLVAQLVDLGLLLHVHGAHVAADLGRGRHVVRGAAVRRELELQDAEDRRGRHDQHAQQGQPQAVIVAAPPAAAGAPAFGLGPGAGLAPRVEVGVLPGEQALVFGVVVVFGPELLEGLRFLDLRLGGPGRGDLRPVQAVTGSYLRGEDLAGARRGRRGDGLRPGVQRVLQAPDRGRGEHPDLRRRGAVVGVARERAILRGRGGRGLAGSGLVVWPALIRGPRGAEPPRSSRPWP